MDNAYSEILDKYIKMLHTPWEDNGPSSMGEAFREIENFVTNKNANQDH